MDNNKKIEYCNPFKANEGQQTCNSCLHYKRCAELNSSTVNLDGCVTCKCYEPVAGYGNIEKAVNEFAEKLIQLLKTQFVATFGINQRPEITFIDKKVYDRIPGQIYALLEGIKNE